MMARFLGNFWNWFAKKEKDKKIKEEWKMKNWNSFSVVTIEFQSYEEGECVMKISQTGIPSDMSVDVLKNGWNEQIFKPMTILLGFPIFSQD